VRQTCKSRVRESRGQVTDRWIACKYPSSQLLRAFVGKREGHTVSDIVKEMISVRSRDRES
jgi:hypothetical protein